MTFESFVIGWSIILSLTSFLEVETCLMGSYDGKRFNKTHSISYPHSVGLLYGTFTDFLGFKPDNDEWKTMALASFSQRQNLFDKKFSEIYTLKEDGFELNLTYFDFYLLFEPLQFYRRE